MTTTLESTSKTPEPIGKTPSNSVHITVDDNKQRADDLLANPRYSVEDTKQAILNETQSISQMTILKIKVKELNEQGIDNATIGLSEEEIQDAHIHALMVSDPYSVTNIKKSITEETHDAFEIDYLKRNIAALQELGVDDESIGLSDEEMKDALIHALLVSDHKSVANIKELINEGLQQESDMNVLEVRIQKLKELGVDDETIALSEEQIRNARIHALGISDRYSVENIEKMKEDEKDSGGLDAILQGKKNRLGKLEQVEEVKQVEQRPGYAG